MKLNYVAFKADSRRQIEKVSIWSFIRSQRGAPLIVHRDFIYRCERKISKRTYWLCIRYKGHKCNARLILNGNAICKETEHNHGTDGRASDANIEFKNLEDSDVGVWVKGLLKQEVKHDSI